MFIQIRFVGLRGVMMDWRLRRERMIIRLLLLRFRWEGRWVYSLIGKGSLSGFMKLLSRLWLLNLAREVFSRQVPPSLPSPQHKFVLDSILMRWGVGGGVHDKKIRFYNTFHGTLLSSLDVDAQITTLIWSPSTTEILATFGYTAPGTSTKCAVYAYPSLQCLFSFDIADEIRALYAVLSPSGQDICVAGSDECVRFYRIWGRRDECVEGEVSPVREVMEGIDGQMVTHTRRRRNRRGGERRERSGLSVIR